MSSFTHFSETSMQQVLWVSIGRKIFSRAYHEPDWNLIHEFDCDIKTIEYTGEIIKLKGPIIFALLSDGRLFYTMDRGNSWILFSENSNVKSIATIKYYVDDNCSEVNIIDKPTLYLLIDSSIKSYIISGAFSFILDNCLSNITTENIFGFDKSIMFLTKPSYMSFVLHSLSSSNNIESYPPSSRKISTIINIDNTPSLLCERGKVFYLGQLPKIQQIFPFTDGKASNFSYVKDIKDVIGHELLLYIQLNNGEMYIGHPDLGWNKIWLPNDDIETNFNYEFDEITDLVIKAEGLRKHKMEQFLEMCSKKYQ